MTCSATDSIQTAHALSQRTYKVDEIASLLGIGRTSAHNLVKQGVFKTVRIGASIRVSKKSFDEWLDNQTC